MGSQQLTSKRWYGSTWGTGTMYLQYITMAKIIPKAANLQDSKIVI